MEQLRRTKIIATLGPISENETIIEKLVDAGVSTFRLNFSHGNKKIQGQRLENIKKVRAKKNLPISIMLDTKGPEIRIGKMLRGKQTINHYDKVTIYTDPKSYAEKQCKGQEITVSYDMSQDVKKGNLILVDDGKLTLKVTKVVKHKIYSVAQNSHIVKTNKRVNIPGVKFSLPFLSKKDKKDIIYGIKEGIDYIAASFVNSPEDVLEIKQILKEHNGEHIQIISKIESQYAVNNFDKILKVTDGVMVARGDLGLEIPYYEVPIVEKMLIRKCRDVGKFVIVATQMLDSMEMHPMPTRAEVTDVYLAAALGADSTMLSGETAAGEYPIEAVEVMSTILKRAEKEFYDDVHYLRNLKKIKQYVKNKRSKIAMKVAKITRNGTHKCVVVLSKTGQLLREVAKFRPNTVVIGITGNEKAITLFGAVSNIFMVMDPKLLNKIHDDLNLIKKTIKTIKITKGMKSILVIKDTHVQKVKL